MANVLGTQFSVLTVEDFFLGNGIECWKVMYTNERGERIPHAFPKLALEHRAAEYDMDPTDVQSLLDLVLHEPHIPDPMDYRNFKTDAAVKAGFSASSHKRMFMVGEGASVPMTLINAPDRRTAGQAHKARIDEVKTRITIKSGKGKGILSKGDTTDPLQRIIDNHGVDPDRVKVRAQYVEAMMADARGQASSGPRMAVRSPGGLPMALPARAEVPYDQAVRRRGLTVALLDT